MRVKCPQCGKDVHKNKKLESGYFPFCSRRCKLADLGGWFDNKYKITSTLNNDGNKNNDRDDC